MLQSDVLMQTKGIRIAGQELVCLIHGGEQTTICSIIHASSFMNHPSVSMHSFIHSFIVGKGGGGTGFSRASSKGVVREAHHGAGGVGQQCLVARGG